MKRYSARPEPEAKAAPRRRGAAAFLAAAAIAAALAGRPAAADDSPLCQLANLAHTALQTASRSMVLMGELGKAVDDRVTGSRSEFKACEQDDPCRTSPRLRDLEEAFNQAHAQKQRIINASAEAVQRKAELEARYKTLKDQAAEAGCPVQDAPNAEQ